MMEARILEQIGLTKSEIKVYFALLELEASTAGPIVKKARISESKVYAILDKLIEKGLAGFVVKNNVKHFQAADPQNLIRMLDEREQAIEEHKRQLRERLIPQIEQRRRLTEERQEATVYESMDGLRSAFNLILETLQRGEEYYVFVLGEALADKRVIDFFRNYHKKRVERGIQVRMLSHMKFKGIIEKQHRYRNMKIRYTRQTLPIGTFIFKNHVMTVVWGERPTAFVIKSSQNYKFYKAFFEELWKRTAPA